MKRAERAQRWWVILTLLAVGCASETLREQSLGHVEAPLAVDRHLELATRYAPWIYHAFHPSKGRQDVPTRVDFDGNLRGDDNWEHLPRFELPPVVSYALLETETHWFIAYHLFHPRDWSYARIGLHETHENDGENLQVVIEKRRGRVVFLWTQAHYFGAVHANQGVGPKEESVRGPLLLVNDAGEPDPHGTHAAVYVQAYGHGIYGAKDPCLDLRVRPGGEVESDESIWILRPADEGEDTPEPSLTPGEVRYHLESTVTKLWPGLADGTLVGEGGLFDGTRHLKRPQIEVDVPRYYEGNRFSGPFGPDRGISPFALCFSFFSDHIGALFFDPANRYPEVLDLPQPWSRTYVGYPFN
jgi:hypothetical protein